MKLLPFGIPILLVALLGCVDQERTVFVTATSVGIGADTASGTADVGYNRQEVVIGPAYPLSAGVPPIYAHLESNLALFSPHVRQLYATGHAAELGKPPRNPHRARNAGHLTRPHLEIVGGSGWRYGARLPVHRQQLVDVLCQAGWQARQDIGQIRPRLDAVETAGAYQAVEHGSAFTRRD